MEVASGQALTYRAHSSIRLAECARPTIAMQASILPLTCLRSMMSSSSACMQVAYVDDGLEAIIFTADGDMRQALNNLQASTIDLEQCASLLLSMQCSCHQLIKNTMHMSVTVCA